MQLQDNDYYIVKTVMGRKYKIPRGNVQTFRDLKQKIMPLSSIPVQRQIIIANTIIIDNDSWPVMASIDGKPSYLLLLAEIDQDDGSDKIYSIEKSERFPQMNRNSIHQGDYQPKGLLQKKKQMLTQEEKIDKFMEVNPEDIVTQRHLTLTEGNKYREELSKLVNMDVVRELMKMGVDQNQAIKACRAASNVKQKAVQTIHEWSLHMVVESRRTDIPVNGSPLEEQMYLLGYLKELIGSYTYYTNSTNLSIVIASYMETEPQLFQLFVKNRLYVEHIFDTFFGTKQSEIS